MTTEAALVLAVLAITVVLLVTQVVRTEVVSLGVILVLALTGVLSTADALSGFSSPATLTVVAMLVLSTGLERAGIVDYVSLTLARAGARSARAMILLLALPAALFSAFMNNTPVVALMIPVTLALARKVGLAPSKLLIPVSYASILGGTCTLIGTSTNILVDSLYRKSGGPGFGMFEFGGLGLVYLGCGLVYLATVGPRLLPHRTALAELLSASAPGSYVTEIVVRTESRLIGRRLGEVFGEHRGVQVLELVRGEVAHVGPSRDLAIEAEDVLLVESDAPSIHSLLSSRGIEQGTVVADDSRVRVQRLDLRVAEMVVTPGSAFAGERVQELGLSRRFGVQVLGIRRLGRHHTAKIRDWRLQPGDVLLVQGEPASLRMLGEDGDVLLVEGVEAQLRFPSRAPVALAIFAAVVLLAAIGVAPIVLLALGGVGAMIATRAIDLRDAIRAVDPAVLLLLAGTIPLGKAMESTGIAAAAATWIAEHASSFGPWLVVGAFYVLTSVLTEVVSNNATAVLLTPIGLGVATTLGIDPKAVLVAIAFGGSASFATPLGYQTNMLVMGPGGYLFRDFLRIGLPLNLLLAVVAAVLIPAFWPC